MERPLRNISGGPVDLYELPPWFSIVLDDRGWLWVRRIDGEWDVVDRLIG